MKALLPAAVLLAGLLPGPLQAQVPPAGLAAALDALIRKEMAASHLPGAAVAVVQDGRVVLLAGYGVADLATRRPVDAERTVFKVGSVSKPFTALAVLQLAERGRLRLDEDVNRALHDVRVPPAFARPVTAADLLTHTAGFDASLIGTAAPRPDGVLPLGRYLAAHLPPRVRPPGQVLAYSNHGYTLLGHLVEEAAGEPFPRYMDEHVFRPVGMIRSRFAPVPSNPGQAAGYELRDGAWRPAPPVYPRIVPAASLETTAGDMARFLLAALAEPASRQAEFSVMSAMFQPRFRQDPRMPGMAWGFFETFAHGQHGFFHGGGIRGFMAGVYLWPERRLGLFVADNGYDGDFVEDVALGLLAHEFPAAPSRPRPAPASPASRERARRCAGLYRLAAEPRGNLEKAAALRRQDFAITALEDGALWIWNERFVEVAPWLYQDARGTERVAFRAAGEGPASLLITEELFVGNQVWERVPRYAAGTVNLTLLLLLVALFLSALVARPAGRRPSGLFEEIPDEPPAARRAVRLGIALAAVDLSFLLLLLLGFRQAAQGAGLLYGLPPLLQATLVLPLLGIPLALALPVCAVQAWRRRFWSTGWRLYYTALAAGGVGFLLFLAAWNLLGIRG